MKLRLWACKELLKRYRLQDRVKVKQEDINLAVEAISSTDATWYQKKAARMILDYAWGKSDTDKFIEHIAVVCDRNDSLVRKWRNKVIERDKSCVSCGEEKRLHAHHISHWADDPINRVNVDNGVTLCDKCHAKEHPDISSLILSGVKRCET